MNADSEAAPDAYTARARSYLRWYPSTWRERYGEEFVAHLEAELAERKLSLSRTFNIIFHGFGARLSLQSALRRGLYVVLSTLIIAASIAGALVARQYLAPLPISSGGDPGNNSSVMLSATPGTVTDFVFDFTSKIPATVRIASVSVVPLRGFSVPKIAGVDFAPNSNPNRQIAGLTGWPPRVPKGTPVVPTNLESAFGRSVTFTHHDALWIGVRAPHQGRAYVIYGLRLTYVRRGVSHTALLSYSSGPNVLCVIAKTAPVSAPQCPVQEARATGEALLASGIPVTPRREAVAAIRAADDYAGATNHAPTRAEVLTWLRKFFVATPLARVTSLSTISGSTPRWRLSVTSSAPHRVVMICVSRTLTERDGYDTAAWKHC